MIKCIIVDDEPLARKVLENHINRLEDIHLITSCSNVLEALAALNASEVHLIFMDIKMPGINGMQFIKTLKNPPPVIFTTAFSEYAADSYELDAVDYLMKPIVFERFEKCISKYLKLSQAPPENKTYTYFKVDGRLVKINHLDIICIQSIKDYVLIKTAGQNYISHMTMKYLGKLLPSNIFKRVHRSYFVNVTHITAFETNMIELGNIEIPVGESYKRETNLLRKVL
ncbi:LytTR family DNA-binding domain-containing protein [Dyadobacter sp. CY312]|uniref:LytR/AlgR family response regulator transcription factor n=1 Tax=Dyadobacter sp. CY312 TaxID=2907303 RepID=UPI001F4791F5|nr:LytTR family DNA-binding domain-containing protein [Dyadobacter sp. CY312]MCE7039029.1 LytTR family DNA-binding domain-containing protein [Dyadobacter sp. CY312]